MAVPVLDSSNVLVAVTVNVSSVSSGLTVNKPLAETVESSLLTLHTTDLGAKLSATTTALSCNILPLFTVAVAGLTVTEVTDGVPGTKISAFANGDVENVFHA